MGIFLKNLKNANRVYVRSLLKKKIEIKKTIAEKRFQRRLKSKRKRKARRVREYLQFLKSKESYIDKYTIQELINRFMPINTKFLLSNEKSNFNLDKITKGVSHRNQKIQVPKHFSLIEKSNESYTFITNLLGVLVNQNSSLVEIDYSECEKVDLEAQVLLDIILKDMLTFYKACSSSLEMNTRIKRISAINIDNSNVNKLLFSVGSPAIHTDDRRDFKDIIPYPLCVHNRAKQGDSVVISEQKDIDTTKLVDYVLSCLKRMGKRLTVEKLDDLCVVISEMLINAEEHSTTDYRFSIGYFHEINKANEHYGMFHLVILNFGGTIYEKFNSPDCPNVGIVQKMKKLSEEYTRRRFFSREQFEEETLWTLYSLQEGVTSVAETEYKKRGNGSIRFIESFFNIKGYNNHEDDFSKMAILSGKTSIVFDGKYAIKEKTDELGDTYKYMTFNNSGEIEEKPDSNYVKFEDNYFPGTVISAKILFNEDDLTNEIK